MTNEAAELTEYITTLGADKAPWWEASGMLGLGLFGSCVAATVLAILLLFGFGVVKQYRESKTWLLPNGRYFLEVFRGASIWALAIAGIKTPREKKISADGAYHTLTPAEATTALDKARADMMALGITYAAAYRSRQFDCEDFATVLKGLATFHASQALDPAINKGIPVSMVAYTRRDKSGALTQSHVDVCVRTTAGDQYFQPYPAHPDPVEMDEGELNSIEWKIT